MLKQKAERPEAGKRAALCHEQAESIAARFLCCILNHVGHWTSRMPVLRIVEEPRADFRPSEQLERIQAGVVGDLDEAGQTCCANLPHFSWTFPARGARPVPAPLHLRLADTESLKRRCC